MRRWMKDCIHYGITSVFVKEDFQIDSSNYHMMDTVLAWNEANSYGKYNKFSLNHGRIRYRDVEFLAMCYHLSKRFPNKDELQDYLKKNNMHRNTSVRYVQINAHDFACILQMKYYLDAGLVTREDLSPVQRQIIDEGILDGEYQSYYKRMSEALDRCDPLVDYRPPETAEVLPGTAEPV